ncbi:hypothetical protein, partial [Methanomethylovorans sp.]|uniref:hypothetical protein n=2 Tax=Methanomethylovorans sp. TaxID=2758717 RepID=UPI00351C12AB
MLKPLDKITIKRSSLIVITLVSVCLLICSVFLGTVLYDHYVEPEQPNLANFEITSISSSSFRIINNGTNPINFDENIVLILESEGQTYEFNSSVIKVLNSAGTYEVNLTQQTYALKIDSGKKVTVKVVDSTKGSVILEEEVIIAAGNTTSSNTTSSGPSPTNDNITDDSTLNEGSDDHSIMGSSTTDNSSIDSSEFDYVSNISSTAYSENSSGAAYLTDAYLYNGTEPDDDTELDDSGINLEVLEEEDEEGTTVLFINSSENPIAGGVAHYYKGGWKDLGTTDSNGKVIQKLDDGTYTFRMTYHNSSKSIRQDIRLDKRIEFQTVNTIFSVYDSNNNVVDTNAATVQYYAVGWKTLGKTEHGTISKELMPANYSFRITYGNISKTMKQDISIDNTVDFRTANTVVSLCDSNNNVIDTNAATVQYYAAGWKTLGTTEHGTASKELMPANYTFRITYGNISKTMKQDIAIDNTVDFRTANTIFSLYDSNNNMIDTNAATIQYYAAGWKTLVTTDHGTASKELMPANYTFRITYGNISKTMKQDIAIDNTVDFRTQNAVVSLYDSNNVIIDTNAATVQYYAAGWKTLGTTEHGTVSKELMPANYTFRIT